MKILKPANTIPAYLGTLSVLLLLSVYLAFNPLQSKSPHSKSEPKAVLGINIQAPNYQIKVNKVTVGLVDSKTQTKKVSLNITLKNVGSSVLQVSPGLQMQVYDHNNYTYKATAKYLQKGIVVGGPLYTNATRTENIDFEVPAKSQPKQFTYQIDGSSPVTRVGL